MHQDDLTKKQLGPDGRSKWAVFLPAISGFYSTFIGKQRNENYVDPDRFPQGLTDMEQLNWLNAAKSLFPYKWSLCSGGHANLDFSKPQWGEDMVRNRDPNTVILGDSGGFQIAKGLWEGDWKANSGCPKAQAKREQVLAWLDNVSDYCMTLDIPTWVIKRPEANAKIGNFPNEPELVNATKFNNDYFIKHRKGVKNGGTKILNVLQGGNHAAADAWYDTMKHYCDPAQYPDTHFNGWAMGDQNMCDVSLILKRLVALRYDNLLQEGVHDWMHFLGTSKLEWAVLLTVIQQAIRKHVNPNFTISFDCASPFLATANGQVYCENVFPDKGKWSYRMAPSADDKKYATDSRKWSDGVVADGFYKKWHESPVSDLLTLKDICIYKPGVPKAGVTITLENFQDPEMYDVLPDFNKNGKWGKTSWDSFSYALLMGHNVWMHLTAVQEANERFAAGEYPAMMQSSGPNQEYFTDIVEAIFSAPDRASAESIIAKYDGPEGYWTEIIGGRGYIGKKAFNSTTLFHELFKELDAEPTLDQNKLDILENEQT